jgi:hypothetical protein
MEILLLAGKKQAGKNSFANYFLGKFLEKKRSIFDFKLTDQGLISCKWYNRTVVLDPQQRLQDKEVDNFFKSSDRYVKLYSFADLLKQNVCMGVLGLSFPQCYGTDEDKNSLTHLKWEDMPGREPEHNLVFHKKGSMTAREVMQFVGTDIFRKMWSDVWVEGLFRKIKKERPKIAVITDCRFNNELLIGKNYEAKSVHLTRGKGDGHESETALDNYTDYDFVLDNKNMSLAEQCKEVDKIFQEYRPR